MYVLSSRHTSLNIETEETGMGNDMTAIMISIGSVTSASVKTKSSMKNHED